MISPFYILFAGVEIEDGSHSQVNRAVSLKVEELVKKPIVSWLCFVVSKKL